VCGVFRKVAQAERNMLHDLARNAGKTIPRDEFLENVWGYRGNEQTRAPKPSN